MMVSGTRRLSGMLSVGGAPISALLLILALPPFHIPLLSFLALVPLALRLASLPASAEGRWQATRTGLVFGAVFWGVSLIWVPLVVGPRFSWAYPGYFLLLVLLGGLSGLLGWATHTLHQVKKLPLFLALALAWVAVEWIKAHFPFGLAFPWLGLGITLSRWPELLGLAEWVGEAGVSFWIAGVNGLVATVLLGGPWTRRLLLALGAAVIPAIAGVVRAGTLPLSEGPEVAVVGTYVPRELRQRPPEAGEEALGQIETHFREAGPLAADLVVLPEATAPYSLEGEEAESAREFLERLSSDLDAPVVVGGLGGGDGPGGMPTNSAFLFRSGVGEVQRYDKTRLVPGMEAGAFLPGFAGRPLSSDGLVLGPLICYESLFGSLARQGRAEGAQLLLNLSSDIWFGEAGSLPGSLFLDQHPAHLVMRAVENRVPVARAANGGFSFLLDPLGRVVSDVVPPSGGLTSARIPTFRGRTLFTRTGDWLGPVSLAFCVLLLGGRGGKGLLGPRKR